jgi:hypothetical protein
VGKKYMAVDASLQQFKLWEKALTEADFSGGQNRFFTAG